MPDAARTLPSGECVLPSDEAFVLTEPVGADICTSAVRCATPPLDKRDQQTIEARRHAFSFARAIQQPALEIWNGWQANIEAAQRALYPVAIDLILRGCSRRPPDLPEDSYCSGLYVPAVSGKP
jgi:fructose-bisphosphate aldolase class I